MPGSQYRELARIQGDNGDVFGEFLFKSLADFLPESTGEVALAAIPIGRLKLAKKLRISATGKAGVQILDNLNVTVDEFISNFRKAGIRSRVPGEFLDKTVLEALQSGNSTIRKLLTNTEYFK